MMGSAPPSVLAGRRVGGYLRNKIKLKHQGPKVSFETMFGSIVGRALVRGGHAPALIEFRRGDDIEDWKDPAKIYGPLSSSSPNAGLGGKLVERAAFGGRLARDFQDYLSDRNRRAPSASVDNFKLTPSSPNTARITVGPDRRERRKKYEWEKVGTQRKIQAGILAVAIPSAIAAGGFLQKRGGGSILKGIKNVSKEGASKSRDIVSAISAAVRGKTFTPAKTAARQNLQQRATAVARSAAERQAAAAAHTPTPEAENVIKPDFKKKKDK